MRIDLLLVKYKQVESRTKAQELISSGLVTYKNGVIKKPSFDISEDEHEQVIVLKNDLNLYVSRAGFKLAAALDHVQLNVRGLSILDVGQSTGGFTDCLLQKNVRSVVGIDVGSGQLHPKIKNHPNVKYFENLNVKDLHLKLLQQVEPFDGLVCDVSFISLTKVIPYLADVIKTKGFFLLLVKPQFECGPENLDKNGIVSDPKIYPVIQQNITQQCEKHLGHVIDYFLCALPGKDGNQEFFIYGHKK